MFTVSREIEKDYIVDFPVQKRFIKLPIENYLSLMDIEPNRPQMTLVNAINDPAYRFVTACYSRRLGKTFISNIIGNIVTLIPGSNVLIMAPNYSLSNISWDLQKAFLRKFDIELAKSNAKDKIIELENGSTIRIGSTSQPDSVVGRSYDLIIFDECALAKNGGSAFNVQLRPTLDKPNSKCIFISTPRGNNWFKTMFDRGFSDDFPEWVTLHADWTENPRASSRDVEAARKSMSEAEFLQEYHADFSVMQGRIWDFHKSNILDSSWDPLAVDATEVIAGLDIGFKDPTAAVVILTDGFNVYIVDEYLKVQKSTEAHAEHLQKLIDTWDIDMFYIDSAAAQTRADLAMTYDISTVKANKDVLAGIAFVSTLVEQGRLFVHPRCVNTLETFFNYQWDPNENLTTEKPLHNMFCHVADAIRYALYTYSVNLVQ